MAMNNATGMQLESLVSLKRPTGSAGFYGLSKVFPRRKILIVEVTGPKEERKL